MGVHMGAITHLTTTVKAHVAAASHRWPAKKLELILVSGQDGGELTVVALAHILQRNGAKVGIITATFIEIAGERANGSDQADVLGDPFRFHGLLAQMRRAGCSYVIVYVPPILPAHHFASITPLMAIQRRCGDRHVSEPTNSARRAAWRRITHLKPQMTVVNRDDPCFVKPPQREATSMTFGAHEKAECRISKVAMHPQGCEVTLLIDHHTELHFTTTLTGKTAVYSLVAAASAAYLLHVSVEVIEHGIAGLHAYPGLSRYMPVTRPYRVVQDTNYTPEGIDETLETLKHFTKNRLIAVIGAHLAQPSAWRPIVGELAAQHADRLIVTDGEYNASESPQTVRKQLLDGVMTAGADPKTEEVTDRQAALEKALSIARRDDTVVILASTQRPYRQTGSERLPWSDDKKLKELL
jgi:UDP-N-acetylmuramoyl-L-alanyl-D-glutamate--2,6-diaminopimelate ligase